MNFKSLKRTEGTKQVREKLQRTHTYCLDPHLNTLQFGIFFILFSSLHCFSNLLGDSMWPDFVPVPLQSRNLLDHLIYIITKQQN